MASVTDPLARSTQYFYDGADRLTRQVLPDGREVLYAYDSTGNLRSVTPPGRPPHQFTYSPVNHTATYEPPSLGAGTWSTSYLYNLDRQLTRIIRPDGDTVRFGYDGAGRPSSVTLPGTTAPGG